MHLNDLIKELAVTTHRGISMIAAGILLWFVLGAAGFVLPDEKIPILYLFGIGVIFPAGIGIAKLMGHDLFVKGNPLAALSGFIGGMQILFAPIVIMVYFHHPQWIPFVVGVLTGAHFIPFVWLYKSKSYLFQSIATVLTASIFGIFFMDYTFVLTPYALLLVYIITFIGLKKRKSK